MHVHRMQQCRTYTMHVCMQSHVHCYWGEHSRSNDVLQTIQHMLHHYLRQSQCACNLHLCVSDNRVNHTMHHPNHTMHHPNEFEHALIQRLHQHSIRKNDSHDIISLAICHSINDAICLDHGHGWVCGRPSSSIAMCYRRVEPNLHAHRFTIFILPEGHHCANLM